MKELHFTESIQIYPLAGESFGVRSFCFLIKITDLSILLDPGCALGPKRYNLPPHPLEFAQQRYLTRKIVNVSKRADYIFISHFHHDHFKPNLNDNFCVYSNQQIFKELYTRKTIFMKNFYEKINFNQQKRGKKFLNDVKNISKSIIIVGYNESSDETIENDKKAEFHLSSLGKRLIGKPEINEVLSINDTDLIFPVEFHHGKRPKDNIFIQPIIIRYKTDAFYSFPDVEGFPHYQDVNCLLTIKDMLKSAISEEFGAKIKQNHIIAFGGTPTYILTSRNSQQDNTILQNSFQNSANIIKNFDISIIDHHIIRDINYRNYLDQFSNISEHGKQQILTMNSNLFSSFPENKVPQASGPISDNYERIPLECNREILFKKYPPSREFYQWLRKAEKNLTIDDPPLK